MEQSVSDFRYSGFKFSYSHADEKWARWLHRSLEAYRVPKHIVAELDLSSNRLIPIFRDREDLPSSGDLSATIVRILFRRKMRVLRSKTTKEIARKAISGQELASVLTTITQ